MNKFICNTGENITLIRIADTVRIIDNGVNILEIPASYVWSKRYGIVEGTLNELMDDSVLYDYALNRKRA